MKATFIEKKDDKRPHKYGEYMDLIRQAVKSQKSLRIECESLDEAFRVRASLAAMISKTKMPMTVTRERNILYCTPQ